jgi:hypothetical protein
MQNLIFSLPIIPPLVYLIPSSLFRCIKRETGRINCQTPSPPLPRKTLDRAGLIGKTFFPACDI